MNQGVAGSACQLGCGRPSMTALLTAALIGVVTCVAGCQGSEQPEPAAPPAAAPAQNGPYNKDELAVYREAVRRVERFEARNQRILAAGKATRQAKELYRDTLLMWQSSWEQLRSYELQGIRIARLPAVFSTEATSIKSFQDNAAEVILSRCTDQSNLGMTRAGVPLPAVHDGPVVQVVVVNRYENRTWRLGPFETTDRPCRG